MKTKTIQLIISLIILCSFLLAFYFYFFLPQLPEIMASHWNVRGEADGCMSKFWGLFLMPFIVLGAFLLFLFVPKIDPLKENIEKFRKYFDIFILIFTLFFLYIYFLTIFWNLGFRFNMGQLMSPAMGFLFFYCGVLIKNAKRNWFIGIKTPWTLSSERVWNKTHKLGGKLFKIAGIITFLGIIFPDYIVWLLLVPILSVTLFTFLYSYFEYQKELK